MLILNKINEKFIYDKYQSLNHLEAVISYGTNDTHI